MWMGGLPPLGYDPRDKKLVVNPDEAKTVRTLFRLYLELGSVKLLLKESHRLGLFTKRRKHSNGRETGGQPFTRGHLYQLLVNPIYVGEVTHKNATYPGQHDAIIEREIFDAVRHRLNGNAVQRHSATNAKVPSLLTGLVYDDTGDRLCPTHANKKDRRYRYYISKRLMHRTGSKDGGWRLPARELEGAVARAVTIYLQDNLRIVDALHLTESAPDRLRTILGRAAAAAHDLHDDQPDRHRQLLHLLLHRVTLQAHSMRIGLKRSGLSRLVAGAGPDEPAHAEGIIDVTVPIELRRRGVEAKLVMRAVESDVAVPDPYLTTLLARAHLWLQKLSAGEKDTILEIAEHNGIGTSDVGRNVKLAFLAPDIVEAIFTGRQPVALTARRLRQIGTLPLEWQRQRRLLGLPD